MSATQPLVTGEEFSPEITHRGSEELILSYETQNLKGKVVATACRQTRILTLGVNTLTPAEGYDEERRRIIDHARNMAYRFFLTELQDAA